MPRDPSGTRETTDTGGKRFPQDSIDASYIHGMFGLILVMGLTKLQKMQDGWRTDKRADFELVRNCVPQDIFLLIYSRCLHFPASGEGNDKMWYMR